MRPNSIIYLAIHKKKSKIGRKKNQSIKKISQIAPHKKMLQRSLHFRKLS